MNTVSQVLESLRKKGSAQTRKTFARHGAPDNMFGVKVGDMKVIAKQIKGNQALALELYDSGNSDAMYLAGLVADGSMMTKTVLNRWAKQAPWYMISEYTVPSVATEHPAAVDLARRWIRAKPEQVAAAGWCTYVGVVATRPDEQLDLDDIRDHLQQIESGIETARNRVRYCMNGFVIGVGSYVPALLKDAKSTARKIGKVEVDVGNTSCKVPLATDAIAKIERMGRVGKKRKTMKC